MKKLGNLLLLLPVFLFVACGDDDTVAARIRVTSELDNFSTWKYTRADDWATQILNCANWGYDPDNADYRGISTINNNKYYKMEINDDSDNQTNRWRAEVEVLDNDSNDIIPYDKQKDRIKDKICEYLRDPDNVTGGWVSFAIED